MQLIDITGQRFERLTVLSYQGRSTWRCRCDCGTEKDILALNLKAGRVRSCGCLQRELPSARLRHGLTRSPEWEAWLAARSRCHSPRHPGYKDYGARGITMCTAWIDDFQAFFDHIGPRPHPKLTLDRIDNTRGYEPGNVRWTTRSEQALNRRPKSYGTNSTNGRKPPKRSHKHSPSYTD